MVSSWSFILYEWLQGSGGLIYLEDIIYCEFIKEVLGGLITADIFLFRSCVIGVVCWFSCIIIRRLHCKANL